MATTTRILDANVNGTVYTANANSALEALDTCHSGALAPTDEVANGKLWLDTSTTPGILKIYNNATWEVVVNTTNVTASGALMDSELTDIASVKALDQGVATTDSPTFADVTATSMVVNGINYPSAGALSNRNVVINGSFDVWQRGTSQTSEGYGSDDRWSNANFGSAKAASQQTFTLGQTDVTGNPKYYSRTVVTSVAGAGNYVLKRQSVEGVTTFSGETATLTFWAKADANKNIAVEFYQDFGTGGSPSGLVFLPTQTASLTSAWVKHSLTFDIPSVSGKTLGTDGTDSLSFHFWFEAGSDYDSRTNSLGQQSGTFDIAQVQLEVGDAATPFEHRTYGEELVLCQRYYTRGAAYHVFSAVANTYASSYRIDYPVVLRAVPTVSHNFAQFINASSWSVIQSRVDSHNLYVVASIGGNTVSDTIWTADAEL